MSSKPLAGITVLEVCNVAAGPFCGMLLADMGAEVIKIENPQGGDTLRSWPPLTEGYSENFASLNRNKKSVTANLKDPDDTAFVLQLVGTADVLIENNRPGVMDRLGLGYEALKKINPRLVYCSLSAYGQSGPRSQEGGFDLTMQAMSGIMSVTGTPDGPPVKCGVPVSDFATGLYAAFSVVSALRQAEADGAGMHIDVSMLGSSLAIAALQTSEYFGSGKNPLKLGSAHPRNAPYQVFRCRDGYFGMAAGNNALWSNVCHAIGRTDLLGDSRFGSPSDRARNQGDLLTILEDIFASDGSEHWLEVFRTAGVPCAPINNYSEILADPQVEHMDWVQELELPNGQMTRSFMSPIRLNGQTQGARLRPPALGEHNAELKAALAARELQGE
ncbi:CaiB/BaiF CoA transferase family protein [Pollutimonas sp. M17]|uniref:CaiB/BaiF CoA transferase family protein n=1 Tax=Pollutimonas sp. M17 TaxID=2962065 RepID=UPI0021F425C1|nr:CoA transferase [Pollutimonas sp. M17]UYO94741.1 CoA transferase [Pollutimonas sp. M17]HWK71299.1 CoA transferase [Burkholderiaceae bacterium]